MPRYAILRLPQAPLAGRLRTAARNMDSPSPRLDVEDISDAEAADLRRDTMVEAISPIMPIRLIAPLAGSAGAGSGDNWGVAAVQADGSTRDGSGVTVAVLDTGIDRTHPAFAGVTLTEKDFSGDGDGDAHGHGTHCAGTIFGRDVGGVRIGVARGVDTALVGKVLRDDGQGDSEMIFKAMTWAIQAKAQVISMSLGFDFPGMVAQMVDDGWPTEMATSTALEAYRSNLRMFDMIMGTARAQDGFSPSPIVVAASGNESRRDLRADFRIPASLPAAADGVISIGAVGQSAAGYQIAPFSNSKPRLVAPGVDIVSAEPGGGLATLSGTSMACPHAAGVAALWWQSLTNGPVRASGTSVSARLLSSVRNDVFAAGLDQADTGDGMVTAPA